MDTNSGYSFTQIPSQKLSFIICLITDYTKTISNHIGLYNFRWNTMDSHPSNICVFITNSSYCDSDYFAINRWVIMISEQVMSHQWISILMMKYVDKRKGWSFIYKVDQIMDQFSRLYLIRDQIDNSTKTKILFINYIQIQEDLSQNWLCCINHDVSREILHMTRKLLYKWSLSLILMSQK